MIGCDHYNSQFVTADVIQNFNQITDHTCIVAGWKNVYTHMMHNLNCRYIVNDLHDTSRSKKLTTFATPRCTFIGDAVYKLNNHISSPWSEFVWMTQNTAQKTHAHTHWLCMMSRARTHRKHIYNLFCENKHMFDLPNYFVFDESENCTLDDYMFRDKIPHSYHKQQHQTFVMTSNKDHWPDGDLIYPYSQSLIELVAETETDMFFITEKTIKPIQAQIPFVVVGCYKFLHRLKKLGFKTFDCVLDESYDSEPNTIKRTQMAFDAFCDFVKNPKGCTDACLHNAKVLQHIQSKNYRKPMLKRKIHSVINSLHGS